MSKVSKDCKSCPLYWTHGIADDIHNKWCCKYGKAAAKAYNHCKTFGYLYSKNHKESV